MSETEQTRRVERVEAEDVTSDGGTREETWERGVLGMEEEQN